MGFHQTNTSKNKIAGIFDLPDEDTRDKGIEIQGEEEFNKDLLQKRAAGGANIDDDIFDTNLLAGNKGGEFAFEDGNLQSKAIDEEDLQDGRMTVLVGNRNQQEANIKYEDFRLNCLLGRGTFGKVFLATLAGSTKQYAIKAIRKDVLIEYNQVKNTQLEKEILLQCKHPFLVGMDFLFQSPERLYFVMPFVRGGELYKVFKSKKRFNEDTVRFYGAQICLAVGYLHGKGIMHRDLKLENVLVAENGYLKIIDYGLAKTLQPNTLSKTFCGTPEYLAPEMVSHQGHDFSVDWWALGILIYEMLIGVTPFYNRERKLLLLKIKQSKVVFPDKTKYKIDYSDEFVDVVLRLLEKDKSKRLGSNGDATEILNHPFFKSLDQEKLLAEMLDVPLKLDFAANANDQGFNAKFFNTKQNAQDMSETVLP
jgi:serum/glucocorticoid-regulated kinase 2